MSDVPDRRYSMVIADDHPVALEGLQSALGRYHDVIGTVLKLADLEETVDRLSPDLLICDLHFRGEGTALPVVVAGVERGTIRCPFLVLTVIEASSHIFEVYRSGAAGYLPKGATVNEIRAAVDAAIRGERTFPPEVENYPATATPPMPRTERSRLVQVDGVELSEREVMVLLDVHRGMSRVEVARRLGVKPRTVEYHLEEVARRIGSRKAGLLMIWVNEQLVELRAAINRK